MTEIAELAMRRLAGPRSGQTFTSGLDVDEFLLVREAGFRPLGMVVGSSIYHLGVRFGRWGRNEELTALSQAMSEARRRAMVRLARETRKLGADGVVGVRLDIEFREFGPQIAEFVATGTAVKADRPGPWRGNGKPFTSDLSGQDFWTLIRAGYAPLGLVMGSCVYHVAHRRFSQVLGTLGRNAEVPQFTEALYDARELAMGRMQAKAKSLRAEGIVGVQQLSFPHRWPGHTTEFFAIGTAVKPLRGDHAIAKPRLVLPLLD